VYQAGNFFLVFKMKSMKHKHYPSSRVAIKHPETRNCENGKKNGEFTEPKYF